MSDSSQLLFALTALSPVDGRYHGRTSALSDLFSEYGLIRFRAQVEIAWFLFLSNEPGMPELPSFPADARAFIAKTAEDAALLLNALASYDPKDSTSIDHPVPDYTKGLNDSIAGLKIGIPKEHFSSGLNPEVASLVEAAIKIYETLGASVHEVSLPHTHLAVPAYYVIAPAECSANLSRKDPAGFLSSAR